MGNSSSSVGEVGNGNVAGATLLYLFKVDVTPPIGDYLCGGLHDTSVAVESPLFLRGLVIVEGAQRYVLANIDFCYLCGRSQQRFVEALAAGAEVPVAHAVLHSNHVHDAPLIDEEAASLLTAEFPNLHNEAYFSDILSRTQRAVVEALKGPGLVAASIAFTQHPVLEFASNRRVFDENGVCQTRWSVCQEEEIRNAPEGRIDPMLDQIIFYDELGTAKVCLHFYASHPQVSDGRRLISSDTVGGALGLFEEENPGIHSIYFSGCAGDITAGKYTTTDRENNQKVFSERLFQGMQGAFESAPTKQPLQSIGWADFSFDLPLRPITESESDFLSQIQDVALPRSSKYLAAMKLFRVQHQIQSYPFRASCLRLNGYNVLFLPSELVIQYQFYAKSRSVEKVAVAAYGDSFLKYVAHDAAFAEGGYEVDPRWSEVEKGIESPICAAIDTVLERAR
jgi:hypothetical protein